MNQYICRFIADHYSVSLVEISASESERVVRVATKCGFAWEIVLPIWYGPSVAILPQGAVAVWAGTSMFFFAEGKPPIRGDFDDEVHAVYAINGALCIIGELSVCVYDAKRTAIIDCHQADDVLGDSWWEGDMLLVENLTDPDRPLIFRPTAEAIGYLGTR